LEQLIAVIHDEYEVTPEQCEADVREFTADMIERGLAQVA
jgi:hypothetical protein